MVKTIFDQIRNSQGDIAKAEVLKLHVSNSLLERVIYLTNSPRINFGIKKIPKYTNNSSNTISLESALESLNLLSDGTYRGNAAIDFLKNILENVTENDSHVIERIIGRDLKINIGTKTINEIYNKELIEVTPYMGAKPFKIELVEKLFKNSNGKGVYADIKADGCYNNAHIDNGVVKNESRQGELVNLENAPVVKELMLLPDGVLNGEFTIPGYKRTVANGIIRSLVDYQLKKNERTDQENKKKEEEFLKDKKISIQEALDKICYTVWDRINLNDYKNKKSTTPYSQRWETLQDIVLKLNLTYVKLIEKRIVYSYQEAMEFFQECISKEEEGIILKSIDGVWVNDKPSYQVKLKLEFEVEMKIIGFNKGTEGTKNENVYSSLKTISEDGLVVAEPGGMNESVMKEITENPEKFLNKIVTVKANGLTLNKQGGHSLFHPRVISPFRHDKSEANSLKEIKEIEEMAMGLKK